MARDSLGRPGRALAYLLMAVVGGVAGSFATRMMDRPVSGAYGPVRAYTEVVEAGRPAAAGEATVQVARMVGPSVMNIDTVSRSRGGLGLPSLGQVQEGQ